MASTRNQLLKIQLWIAPFPGPCSSMHRSRLIEGKLNRMLDFEQGSQWRPPSELHPVCRVTANGLYLRSTDLQFHFMCEAPA